MAKFEGNFEGFRVTPDSALASNSIVKQGALIGVTRQNIAADETGIAFMTNAASVYTLELATTAVATATVGTPVKDNGSGKIAVAGDGDAAIGCLFAPIAVGDKEATVLLYPSAAENGNPVASNVAALTAFGDPADTNYTTSELKTEINAIITGVNAILTALKGAGLMTADSAGT